MLTYVGKCITLVSEVDDKQIEDVNICIET